MSEDDLTCDRCGTQIEVPGNLSAGYGQSLCLECAHPAYRGSASAP